MSIKYCLAISPTPEMKIFSALVIKQNLTFSRSALFHIKTIVCLEYFVNDCLRKQFLASDSLQTRPNWICLKILVTLKPLTQFWLKIRAANLQKKALKFTYSIISFPNLFSKVQGWYWKLFNMIATLFMHWKLRRFEEELKTFLRRFVKTLPKHLIFHTCMF